MIFPWTKSKNATLDDTGGYESENPSKHWEWYCYYDLGDVKISMKQYMNSCRTWEIMKSWSHETLPAEQWQTEWLRSIGDDQWSPKKHGNRSQLSTNQKGMTQGLDALPGMPVYAGFTSGHPAIGSPWSCWGIRDRGVKWCEKRETWGAQLVARLHKILTCKKKWCSRLIDCICCIMLHIFMFDYAYRILSMRMMWLKQPKNIGSTRPAAQVSQPKCYKFPVGGPLCGWWVDRWMKGINMQVIDWSFLQLWIEGMTSLHPRFNIGCRMFQGSSSSFPYTLDAKKQKMNRNTISTVIYMINPQHIPRPVEWYWTWSGRWLRWNPERSLFFLSNAEYQIWL